MPKLLFILLMLFPTGLTALPETEFPQRFEQEVMAYFKSQGTSQSFQAKDGVTIHFRSYTQGKHRKALVILPGRTESTFRFAEVLWDLRDLPFDVYIIDHRGQGASTHLVPDPQMQGIGSFQDYEDDLHQFMTQFIQPKGYEEVSALAHSMGVLITAQYAMEYPKAFRRLILSSPMADLPPGPTLHEKICYAILVLADLFGKGNTYIPGQGPWDPDEAYRGTTSATRYQFFRQLRIDHPKEIIGGTSMHWYKRGYETIWDTRKRAAELEAPILMFQAGADEIISGPGQDIICQKAKNCRKLRFEKANHDIHLETDVIRDQWLLEVRRFLQ